MAKLPALKIKSESMIERKFCWQKDYLRVPTPCFKLAGNRPCETAGCSVDEKVQELQARGIAISLDWIEKLAHSRCRLSSLSKDNHEFQKRLANIIPLLDK